MTSRLPIAVAPAANETAASYVTHGHGKVDLLSVCAGQHVQVFEDSSVFAGVVA
jgi:hypothetical protein